MQEPVVLFAVDPGERALAARDEVVALRLVAVPPAALDALRAGKQMEVLVVDLPGRIHEPNRARAGLAELARVPLTGLDAPPRVLGTVVGLRREAVDRLGA